MSVGVVEYKLHQDRAFEKEKHLKNSFLENFLMSVMVMCIKEGKLIINKSLKDREKEPSFKLLYSPNIVNLLRLLNMFLHREKGDPIDLSDASLLKENVGSLIGRMLDERCNLLSDVSEKLTFLRSSVSINIVDGATGLPRNEIVNDHKDTVNLQTNMLVIRAFFDLYKVISIELQGRVDYENRLNESADFFEQYPSCVNGYLMKNEYQTMIDSIRESLPLMNGMNGHFVKFCRDPLQHEAISDTCNLSFC